MRKITFIGAGQMATAITNRLKKSDDFAICAFDISDVAKESFKQATGIAVCADFQESVKDADIVILAVKPQYFEDAILKNKEFIYDKLIISIMAGIKIDKLESVCNTKRVVRVMPNTPALVGCGASAYSATCAVNEDECKVVENILDAIGEYCKVPEKLIDSVTGLSGSGPAYVFDFIQALADGGVKEGLPRDAALKLATQTVLGTAKMLQETGEHPSVLRDKVTSPGGTTAAGLFHLGKNAFKGIVSGAVSEATKRSRELGN